MPQTLFPITTLQTIQCMKEKLCMHVNLSISMTIIDEKGNFQYNYLFNLQSIQCDCSVSVTTMKIAFGTSPSLVQAWVKSR